MLFLKDKLLIFIICLAVYGYFTGATFIVPVLCIIIVSGLNSHKEHLYVRTIGLIIYLICCLYRTEFIYFLPLIAYDIFKKKGAPFLHSLLLLCMLGGILFNYYSFSQLIPIFLAGLISVYLKQKTSTLDGLSRLHYESKNELESTASFLEQKNKALLEKQDSEIHIATLNERNRIAREIHDNVGHLLSRCLLQIGALMVLAKKDEVLYTRLGQIKETLTAAMNSIRSSVHDLHDESLDLETELNKLIQGFDFCHIHLDYDITTLPNNEVKYSFIAIVKEALANVIKHSHATEVEVLVHEHPAFYQLVIKDNDLSTSSISSSGIGLYNMQQRISSLNGQFSIDTTKGFKIFISVPKKKGNTL